MCRNEGISEGINAVIYYSNTGQCRAIAKYLANRLSFTLLEITEAKVTSFKNAVMVFPVYCQNIPGAVRGFLDGLRAEWLSVAAVYGRMCFGNVLYELRMMYKGKIAAGAYIPTKHSYICEEGFTDFDKLNAFADKVTVPLSEAVFPRKYKNPFANVFPALRSRMGVKLKRTEKCTQCGMCDEVCVEKAIKKGVPNSKCIRCLGCVSACPNKALEFKCTLPMKLYLKKKKINELILYL